MNGDARPICFVVMPYRTRKTGIPKSKGPTSVDFDALWSKALLPAVERMGYDAVRADQDLNASIVQEMLERLALADLVLADVSLPNPNVFYEVGVRHAAKARGCVLIAAAWSQQPFDTAGFRQLRYPLADGTVPDAEAARIAAALEAGVPGLREGWSPVHALEGYPELRPERTLAFRDFVNKMRVFETAVRRVRLERDYAARGAQALALVEAYRGRPVVPAVAVELLYLVRDCVTDWKETVAFVDALPEDLRQLPLVQEQRSLALSKDGDHRGAIAALESLVATVGDSSERQGLLGGRYKQMWREAPAGSEEAAEYLSKAIAHYDRGMHLDLNDYYPSCNLPRLYRARKAEGDADRASGAAHVVVAACERARALGTGDEWLKATLLGAAFDAGDGTTAKRLAREVRQEGPKEWKLDTTLVDLRQSAAQHADAETRDDLERLVVELEKLL